MAPPKELLPYKYGIAAKLAYFAQQIIQSTTALLRQVAIFANIGRPGPRFCSFGELPAGEAGHWWHELVEPWRTPE